MDKEDKTMTKMSVGKIDQQLVFDEIGKTTFVFRTEIADKDLLNEALMEAIERFETTTTNYKIRVFTTSEFIERGNEKHDTAFLTFKLEGKKLGVVLLRMARIINYLTLLDFGIRSKERFDIAEDNKSVYLMKTKRTVSARDVIRKGIAISN